MHEVYIAKKNIRDQVIFYSESSLMKKITLARIAWWSNQKKIYQVPWSNYFLLDHLGLIRISYEVSPFCLSWSRHRQVLMKVSTILNVGILQLLIVIDVGSVKPLLKFEWLSFMCSLESLRQWMPHPTSPCQSCMS